MYMRGFHNKAIMDLSPAKLNLKRDEKLEIIWKDGDTSIYPIAFLRSMCPCALCKEIRDGTPHQALPEKSAAKNIALGILPGNFDKPVVVQTAELVGNYGLRIEWSDKHGSGIYSWVYLREIDPKGKQHECQCKADHGRHRGSGT